MPNFFLGNRKDIYTSSFNISQDKFKFIFKGANQDMSMSHAKWVNVFDGNKKVIRQFTKGFFPTD